LTLRNQIQFSENVKASPIDVLYTANLLTGEEIEPNQLLTKLSGGQSRALMIADVALNNSAPVILIDEVENAGIDRIKAMSLLTKHEKIVLVVTHDPLLALYGLKRIVLKNGGISHVIDRTNEEKEILEQLINVNSKIDTLRQKIRNGESLKGVDNIVQ